MDFCEAFMVAESMQLATVTSKGNEQITGSMKILWTGHFGNFLKLSKTKNNKTVLEKESIHANDNKESTHSLESLHAKIESIIRTTCFSVFHD